MAFYAHKKEALDGRTVRQSLADHLRSAANISAACLHSCGLRNAAYLAGLLHDLGKYTSEFQAYLEQGDSTARGSIIHSFQGCRFLLERFHDADDIGKKMAAELLAYAVGAHHGLFDCVDEGRKIGLKYRKEKSGIQFEEASATFLIDCADAREIDALYSKAAGELNRILEQIDSRYPKDDEYCFAVGLLARLLLSAVMEGDRRDTAEFMSHAPFPVWPEDMRPIWGERLRFLENKLAQFSLDTAVSKARHAISQQCRQFAEQPGGIYRLYVPTGGGKTLSALRYALAHAEQFNRKRLIFTSPLLSILEQNANVLRAFIGDDSLILEHHSNVVQTQQERDTLDERELLAQNWNAPIIITTLVQLLNTLFDGKTTAIRRFHALCGSVIVIDEVQSVPAKLLTMFNLSIRFLSEQCCATVVLCSATQPCLEWADHPLPQAPRDIVPYDAALWAAFSRTQICPLDAVRQAQLPGLVRELMEQTESLLVVCNKKDEAARLLEETEAAPWRSFHLSAAMCMQHRRDTLQALYDALEKKEKVLCISTQVIEAGVDISFQSVLRLAAGMDSVVQSAGRCNRNGESQTRRPVYLVNCADEKLGRLREIQRGKDASTALVNAYQSDPDAFAGDLASDAAIQYYYRCLYQSMDQEAQDYPLGKGNATLFNLLSLNSGFADEDCDGLADYCLYQAFQRAGQAFAVFDEDTTDVLVPYGDGRRLIEALCSQRAEQDTAYRQALLKQAGNYSVSLYQYQKKRLEQLGALQPLCGGCALALQENYYHEITGLKAEENPQAFWEV